MSSYMFSVLNSHHEDAARFIKFIYVLIKATKVEKFRNGFSLVAFLFFASLGLAGNFN